MTIAPSCHATPNHHRKRSLEEVCSPCHHDDANNNNNNNKNQGSRKIVRSDFHLNRMDHWLQWALKCAREGNLRMMEFYLGRAKQDAIQTQSYGPTFCQWESWIREQLLLKQQQQQIGCIM